jgi:hypothetical protein
MPFVHGKAASLWLDQYDVSQFFNELGLDFGIDTAETSTFQGTWKTFIEGLAGAKIAAKGFYDKVNDAYLMTNIMDGGSVLTAVPGGSIPAAVGDTARLVFVHATDILESSPVGGAVLASVAYQSDQPVGFGTVLHGATVTDVGTTTGAGLDGLAATTTGWHAHLHVIAVTGAPTSWTVKLVDASASNFSDVADLAGAGFTAGNNPTGFSQRLSSSTATATVRRYVRYVATVVGGTAPTITFGLAFSRN